MSYDGENKGTWRSQKFRLLSVNMYTLAFITLFHLFGNILAYKEWWEDSKVKNKFLILGF